MFRNARHTVPLSGWTSSAISRFPAPLRPARSMANKREEGVRRSCPGVLPLRFLTAV
jgi:hypothetical protein